jgi:hypothetical protein
VPVFEKAFHQAGSKESSSTSYEYAQQRVGSFRQLQKWEPSGLSAGFPHLKAPIAWFRADIAGKATLDLRPKSIYQISMMRFSLTPMVLVGLLGVVTSGCASSPVAPFNTMAKAGNVVVLRLQNTESPVAAAQTAPAAGAQSLIPGLPVDVNNLVQQGAAALQQILPPGTIPNLPQPAAAPATMPEPKKFYGFRVLGENQVMDSELREKLGKIFGSSDNYEAPKTTCMYPDFGVAFGPTPGAPTYDYLVSMSCHQVQSKSFAWPLGQTGMTVNMEKDLVEILRQILPG